MIVFKYFFKILKKYKFVIILYTAILIIFGAFSLKSNNNLSYTETKPDICIVNKDENIGITKDLCEYLEINTNVKQIENDENKRNDALFYREVSYIIYIPENFNQDFIKGNINKIEVQSTGDYEASLAEMLLNNYIKTANIYIKNNVNEAEIVNSIHKVLDNSVEVTLTSTVNNDGLAQAKFYYNFANYSILAICIYIVATVMSSFRENKIKNRTKVSGIKNREYNREIFLGIIVLGIILWAVYSLISVVLIKDIMLSVHGIYYALNSFIFTICALAIAFLIGNVLSNKEAISGLANVISLGSAFLCGSFVPAEFLPDFVIKIAHIFPSYWYIQNNELIATLSEFNLETLKPFIINCGIILLFILLFIIITNIYSKKKR